jgi:hypothetical protein
MRGVTKTQRYFPAAIYLSPEGWYRFPAKIAVQLLVWRKLQHGWTTKWVESFVLKYRLTKSTQGKLAADRLAVVIMEASSAKNPSNLSRRWLLGEVNF